MNLWDWIAPKKEVESEPEKEKPQHNNILARIHNAIQLSGQPSRSLVIEMSNVSADTMINMLSIDNGFKSDISTIYGVPTAIDDSLSFGIIVIRDLTRDFEVTLQFTADDWRFTQ